VAVVEQIDKELIALGNLALTTGFFNDRVHGKLQNYPASTAIRLAE
jgi:hypothetical protein